MFYGEQTICKTKSTLEGTPTAGDSFCTFSNEHPSAIFSIWLVAINHSDPLRKSTSITNIHTGPELTRTEHFSHQEYWNNILGMPRANANKEGFRSEKPPSNDNKFKSS